MFVHSNFTLSLRSLATTFGRHREGEFFYCLLWNLYFCGPFGGGCDPDLDVSLSVCFEVNNSKLNSTKTNRQLVDQKKQALHKLLNFSSHPSV